MKTFLVHQKITAFANQYRVYESADSQPGAQLAFVHQKRLALREKIIFYTDDSKQDVSFQLQARTVMELAGVYDVLDGNGHILGTLRKQFKASILRSTWHLCKPDSTDVIAVVRERSMGLAIFRRLWQFVPYIGGLPFFMKYHFDFTDPHSNDILATYEKTTLVRDHYQLDAQDPLLAAADWRVLVAQGVALDALQNR
jgi:uncharacterized protein YxjI